MEFVVQEFDETTLEDLEAMGLRVQTALYDYTQDGLLLNVSLAGWVSTAGLLKIGMQPQVVRFTFPTLFMTEGVLPHPIIVDDEIFNDVASSTSKTDTDHFFVAIGPAPSLAISEISSGYHELQTSTNNSDASVLEKKFYSTVSTRVEATDEKGRVVSEVSAGDVFYLNIYVHDQRSNALGVFHALFDLDYDHALAAGDGKVKSDRVGGIMGIEPTGSGEQLLSRVKLTAAAAGEVEFSLEPILGLNGELLLFGENAGVALERIKLGTTKLTIRS